MKKLLSVILSVTLVFSVQWQAFANNAYCSADFFDFDVLITQLFITV